MRSLVLLAALSSLALFGQDLPDGAEVVDRYLEATGGAEAYARVRTYRAVATIEYVGKPLRGTLRVAQAMPDRSYTLMEFPGVDQVESGTADGVAWERSKKRGARIKTGVEREQALREASPQARLRWRDYYQSAACTGVEMVEGNPCFRVVMTPKEGKPETRYYDQNTGLLLRVTRVIATPMGETVSESRFTNYRPADGILTPHSLTQTIFNSVISTQIQMVQVNAEIPEAQFALPAEVKLLLEKGLTAAPPARPKK